jgi:hypothetical protein
MKRPLTHGENTSISPRGTGDVIIRDGVPVQINIKSNTSTRGKLEPIKSNRSKPPTSYSIGGMKSKKQNMAHIMNKGGGSRGKDFSSLRSQNRLAAIKMPGRQAEANASVNTYSADMPLPSKSPRLKKDKILEQFKAEQLTNPSKSSNITS